VTAQLAQSAGLPSVQAVWSWLENVPDPEIPVLNIVDLGIVRGVAVTSDNVVVEVAPTYSGCPATEIIEKSIRDTLLARGVGNVVLKRVLAPPWTTAWITEEGREKLRAYGIAPPLHSSSKRMLLDGARTIACPRCGTSATTLVSEFGSTPCKASYKCDDCFEPFEYFKCI
jgi:ring-1,2-phenylacetyl-CoA epoxidase subunit PaaD